MLSPTGGWYVVGGKSYADHKSAYRAADRAPVEPDDTWPRSYPDPRPDQQQWEDLI